MDFIVCSRNSGILLDEDAIGEFYNTWQPEIGL